MLRLVSTSTFPAELLPSCLAAGVYWCVVVSLFLGRTWLSPFSPAYPGPSGWQRDSLVSWPLLPVLHPV